MRGYLIKLEEETLKNTDYRRVLYTAKNSQLVLMSLPPGCEIGEEVHKLDQFIRFEEGVGSVILNDDEQKVGDGDAVVIPAGTKHNVVNISKDKDLKLYSVYSPAEHKSGTLHKTKEDADGDHDHHFDGQIDVPD